MLSDILASQSQALAAGNSINFTLPTFAKDFDQAGQIQVLYLNGTLNNFSKKKKKIVCQVVLLIFQQYKITITIIFLILFGIISTHFLILCLGTVKTHFCKIPFVVIM